MLYTTVNTPQIEQRLRCNKHDNIHKECCLKSGFFDRDVHAIPCQDG
jgi:hypothetical protein